jgi:hypothetical protein
LVDLLIANTYVQSTVISNTDEDFLKRVLLDSRGTPPTSLEEKYFAEDKDPKKREKLLDTLLKDPAIAKKLGDEWKKRMLAAPALNSMLFIPMTAPTFEGYVQPNLTTLNSANLNLSYNIIQSTLGIAQPARQEKLVDELLAAKKSDAEMVEAITLATAGRLPTDTEKRLTLGLVSKASDRKAAWVEAAKALSTTEGATQQKTTAIPVNPSKNEAAPLPPAKK